MGGYIDGKKERVPGTILKCNCCKREMLETEFHFSFSKGYLCHCKVCHRKKLKNYRDRHREELIKQNGVTRHSKVENKEITGTEYKFKLMDIAKNIHVGDTFKIRNRIGKVCIITGSYVVVEYPFGVKEAFLWDDMQKIINNTFKGEEDGNG